MQIIIKLSVGDSQLPTWTGNYQRSFLGPSAVHANTSIPCSYDTDPGAYDPYAYFHDEAGSAYYHNLCDWSRVYP
jgi:hypothetical protein